MPSTVLIVDDEPDLCRLLEFNLRSAGFVPHVAMTGKAALELAAEVDPDLVVLDLMLPDQSGLEVCRTLRAMPGRANIGILMLTARGTTTERVDGLEAGADDYVVKPFELAELVARVRALARRCAEHKNAPPEVLSWRGVSLDQARHRLTVDGDAITLRPMEQKLLALFLAHPGEVFSRERLLADVWGLSGSLQTRTVDVHVQRLRQHVPALGDALETLHGVGYRLREP
jgi:two-component system, OmpR family, phosphate regulon response regulator PhoB